MASPVEQFKLKSLVPFELGGSGLIVHDLVIVDDNYGSLCHSFFNIEHARRKVSPRAVAINGGNVL